MPLNPNNNPKVENVGSNIFLVDPNPPGMGMHPPEDMFIYVKFAAYERNRSDLVETSGEINFIATQVNYNAEGEITTNDEGNQKTYATTNYSKIGGTVDAQSQGVLEGFGIKNIDIKYDASLVPRVDITFTDVRGASLFDVIDNDNRKSPYSIFFKMPYPIFKLSVKGYFGKTVDYCLHMINWTSNFDGSTGNFDISANFVGFQQAFLADMVLGNIIGVVNTSEGLNNLNKLYDEQQQLDDTLEVIPERIRKIDDLFIQISRLQLAFEDVKDKNDNVETLRGLNELVSKLKTFQSFVGTPIRKTTTIEKLEKEGEVDPSYLEIYNKSNVVNTSSINDNSLKIGSDYLSIRDFILVNAIRIGDMKEYFKTFEDIAKDYQSYLVTNSEKFNKLSKGKISKDDQQSLLDSFKLGDDNIEFNYQDFLYQGWNNKEKPKKLDDVFGKFNQEKGILNLGPPPDNGDVNSNFDPTKYFNTDQEKNRYKQQMSLSNNVYTFDLREIRSQIENTIQVINKSLVDVRKEIQTELNKEVKERLGINPTISNIFRIICNNTDAMLLTIQGLRNDVKNPAIAASRKEFIENTYDNSDVPQKFNDFMWPTVYQQWDDSGAEEVYLGEEALNNVLFPEVTFVEDVYNKLTARQKVLNQITKATAGFTGKDTDNWFPINPYDYDENPFLIINQENNITNIIEKLSETIIDRISIIKNYSNFTGVGNLSPLEVYGQLDGINANKTIFAKLIRDAIKNTLTINDVYYRLHPLYSISESDYLIMDERITSKIVGNSKSLWGEIKTNDNYTEIIKYKQNDQEYWSGAYYNNNLTNKLFNHIWLKDVGKKLNKGDKKNTNYKINNINDIDITGGTQTDGAYINILNPNVGANNQTYPITTLTDQSFYGSLNKKTRALLLLSTFPFDKFNKVVDVLKTQNAAARVMVIPEYYLYFIGALVERYMNDGDFDFGSLPTDLYSPKNQYINKIGAIWKTHTDFELEDSLTFIPAVTKQLFRQKFNNWVDRSNGFLEFESNVKLYKSADLNITNQQKNNGASYIVRKLQNTINVVFTTPAIFTEPNNYIISTEITLDDVTKYFKTFKQAFDLTKNEKGEETDTEKQKTNSNKTETQAKLQIYNYFKNINNKWVADKGKESQVCGTSNQLFDYFKFIDRGWSDIGDKAVLNLNSVLGLSNDLNSNIYFFISRLLRDSNFLLQILPTYINYKDPTEVADIFKPIPNISDKNRSRGPAYVCIFAGGNSEVLDIGENTTYSYPNDGFAFGDKQIPSDFNSDNSLVAFKVGFGAQNQTMFKNVSLNQQEHRETAEYFQTLADVVDKRGGTNQSYQGSDLLKLFKTRSYTCKVDAIGCMNIQPLMYFDLQNVPFFHGAYLITGVNHNITPNHMTTNFTGLRQSKFINSYVSDPTTYLNIDLKEDLDDGEVIFSNNDTSSPIYSVGLDEELEKEDFDYGNINDGNLTPLGVSLSDGGANRPTNATISTKMLSGGIISNSQATMFLANMLSYSDSLKDTSPGNPLITNSPNIIGL